jgi:hypothetical protein
MKMSLSLKNSIQSGKLFTHYTLSVMKPNGLNHFLQIFLYKTFCLSKIHYGMELFSLNLSTIKKLNSFQNSLIRNLFKLPKFSHMTNLLCALNIFDIRVLQYKFKLIFLKRVNDHPLTKQIFEFLYSKFNVNTKSSSFLKNIYDIMEILNCNLETF